MAWGLPCNHRTNCPQQRPRNLLKDLDGKIFLSKGGIRIARLENCTGWNPKSTIVKKCGPQGFFLWRCCGSCFEIRLRDVAGKYTASLLKELDVKIFFAPDFGSKLPNHIATANPCQEMDYKRSP